MANIQTAERCSQNEASDNVVFQRHLFAYEQAAALISGTVAEVGCGEGYGMRLLLPKSELYMAMDKYPSKVGKEQAEKLIFKQMNFPDFGGVPIDFFDFIICFQVVEHIEADELFIKKMSGLLKQGGKLILTTPNVLMSLTRNPFHVREYTYSELDALIRPFFSKTDIRGVFGKQQATAYFEANKASVARFRRLDPFDFEHRLPAAILKIPYDLLNRWNRRKLLKEMNRETNAVTTEEFYLEAFAPNAYDFFVVAEK